MRETPAPHSSREVLGRTPAFADLGAEVLDRFLDDLRERTYEPGEALIRQGDPGDGLLVMVSGTAVVELRASGAPGDGGVGRGGSRAIAGFGPEDVVGEMSLVTREPRSADVVATAPVRALWLSIDAFDRLVLRFPEVAVVLTNLVAARLGESSLDGLGGKSVGDYRIVRAVGRGGMAVVYEAVHVSDGRRVALKMMSHRLVYESGAAARFRREAATLMSLDHPHVARVYDCFSAFRTSFIAMEFCDGVDLDRLQGVRGPLDEDTVRRIVGQVAGALLYLHGRRVIHRDLKPSNVMLTRAGTVMLTDFGLSRQVGIPIGSSITAECSILGTPRYMTPAQLRGERAGAEADVYALGLVALELCQGSPPFPVSGFADLLQAKQSFVPPPAREIGRGVSEELHRFIVAATTRPEGPDGADLEAVAAWAAPVPPSILEGID